MSKSKMPSGKSSTKAKTVAATLRSTSGAGFNFEDLIAAWQIAKSLTGEEVPGIGGAATMLQAQVASLGWRMDDLLLTSEKNGSKKRLGISAKGNQQVADSGLPADFVLRAWEQWRSSEGPFDPETDGLALVTIGLNHAFNESWREVKNACDGADIGLAISRIRSTPRQLRVFESVQTPQTTAMGSDEETVALIRRLHVLPTDLQFAYSETENQAILQCRGMLASSDPVEAKDLWQHLINDASEVRLRKGSVTIHDLLAALRRKFQLRHHPDYAPDWATLAAITADYKARIETALPSGYAAPREAERTSLRKALAGGAITVVFGESGCGKSSLVKLVLDTDSASLTQVWLGPEELRTALSAARRSSLPLRHELSHTLNATVNPANVLVIDSAERIDPVEFVVVRKLLASLVPHEQPAELNTWRVIIVTQTQGFDVDTILTGQQSQLLEIKQISIDEAKLALIQSPALSWLRGHNDTVAALTNLRTLGWVVRAGPALGSTTGGLAAHTAIADRLWAYWTQGRADVQAMVMRLSQREAAFERSFALSELASADTTIFTQRPPELPLRLNGRNNSIEFEHDLAADWARFQFLKQIWTDTPKWAAFSANPLWTNALRMLGQFLLRQPGAIDAAWDEAYRTATAIENALARNILLDALCLDPDAEHFLTERIEMLLEGNASGLEHLLMRFHHIATVPSTGSFGQTSALGVYFDVKFRSIIFARWPPVLRFLIAKRERLQEVVSTALGQIIETWLTQIPRVHDADRPMPFRRDLAQMALAMARTVQAEKGRGVMYVSREPQLYSAALAAAPDLPDEVGEWALELAGRREVQQKVKLRIAESHRKQAADHTARLKTDEQYRLRHERSRRASGFVGSFRERLPAWPLGASREVDMDFRTACLEDGSLRPLIDVRPEVAAEILLALIIEDRPEGGHDRYEIDLGLHFPRNAYPTAFWKSPFFAFLQSAPTAGLGALIALVNFCTERWVTSSSEGRDRAPPGVKLQFANGLVREFAGRRQVFGWVQSNDSMRNGNLYCALDALERWLIMRLNASNDISAEIHRLLHEGNSAAFIGVLVNVAKYRPQLLNGVLAPLLTVGELFYWDAVQVKKLGDNFVASAWLRDGETVFNFARDWTLAAHRKLKLVDLATELILGDDEVAHKLRDLIPTWPIPENPKAALEHKLLYSALDSSNYRDIRDPQTGKVAKRLVYPVELVKAVEAWESAKAKPLEYLTLPDRCWQRLEGGQPLSAEEATYLYSVFEDCEAAELESADDQAKCALAVASTLLVLAEDRFAPASSERERVLRNLRLTIARLPSNAEEIREGRFAIGSDELAFASRAVIHLWQKNQLDAEWETSLVRLMTTGDVRSAATIAKLASARREELGPAFWRLLHLGILWSGLALLMPRSGDEGGAESVWVGWLTRLRRFRLRGPASSSDALNFGRVAAAVGRLQYDREMRLYLAGDGKWRGRPERRHDNLLDVHFLDGLFAWLLDGRGSGDPLLDERLTLGIWDYDARRAQGYAKADRHGEYDLPSQNLGYNALIKLANLALSAPVARQRVIWEPVLRHGPAAHYAVQHFVNGLYLELAKTDNVAAFKAMWRPLVEYALSADWSQRGLWFHGEQMLCDILGFGHEAALARLPSDTALHMQDIYETWARTHLDRDEYCVVRFAQFLTTCFATLIQLEGLCWIAAMLKADGASGSWYRENTGEALVNLAAFMLNVRSADLAKNSAARQALIDILANLAAKNVQAAMPLQERVKLLR